MTIEPIAYIHTGYKEKFGIPRQSGLVPGAMGRIVFEETYRKSEALLGLEEWSHLWLIWGFSENDRDTFRPLVAPPRLGGKVKKGVFATRASFRPNGLGLSCVVLESIDYDCEDGPVIVVSGVDMLDHTPIYDIKPYEPYADAYPNAAGSFGQAHAGDKIQVAFPTHLQEKLPESIRETIYQLLEQDPRAAYNKQPDYVYGMVYDKYDIRFVVEGEVLSVREIVERQDESYKNVK